MRGLRPILAIFGLLIGCGEALPPRTSADGGAQATDSAVLSDCSGYDSQAACDAAGARCMSLVLNLAKGTAPDGETCYHGEGVPNSFGFAVCIDAFTADTALTGDTVCAVNPGTGEFFHFWSGSLVPPDWKRCADVAPGCQ
jgi:hypothetical protein